MTKYVIGAKEYTFRFDLEAMEQIENEFGGIREMYTALAGSGKQIASLRAVFRILANNGEEYEGRPAEVTGREIMRLTTAEMSDLMEAIKAEIMESSKPKDQAAQEEEDGVVIDDGDAKNAEAGN